MEKENELSIRHVNEKIRFLNRMLLKAIDFERKLMDQKPLPSARKESEVVFSRWSIRKCVRPTSRLLPPGRPV